ncbi:hypothetical protein [Bacillus sp. AFS017336]|uniref:hypothetical protein n=1 Tax=Bacillus sp. AFS017336 TaxID=2033489 RepID=UPI000BF215BC|nr:hypothetical protein [Bacillus sp. AFS017336]PEK98336.1 hypothetical protein CN601_25855 [Bacillus sp. AFS017336]
MTFKRKMLNSSLFILTTITLAACNTENISTKKATVNKAVISSNEIQKGFTLEELDIEKINESDLKQKINMQNDNGVYLYDYKSKKEIYILFNGVGTNYSNIKFKMNGQKLAISYRSTVDKGMNIQSLFELKSTKQFDGNFTITLKNNDKETAFANIYTQ